MTLMGFLEPSLGFVWGEPIKVRQQKPVDEKYLDEAVNASELVNMVNFFLIMFDPAMSPCAVCLSQIRPKFLLL